MAYTISKTFDFSASHQLGHLAKRHPNHKCCRLHGHNYSVEVILSSPELDSLGFVVDYGALLPFRRWIEATLDHRHLNQVRLSPEGEETTVERLAEWIHGILRSNWPGLPVVAVRVSESPKTWAEFRP